MNIRLFRTAPRQRALACTILATLTAGAAAGRHPAHAASAADQPWGTWTGTLVADAGHCPDEAPSTLQVSHRAVTFTPGDQALALHGTRHKDDGSVHAELILSDRNRKPLPMVFNAQPTGDGFTGQYGTTTCRAHVVLKRAE